MLSKTLNLFIFLCVAFTVNGQVLKNGDYFEKVGALQLHYTVKGKGPIMIVGHPNSGKIGYELSLKPLEAHFTMVYYEPRGTGSSDAPANITGYQQDAIVAEMDNLRALLHIDKVWLFGHSDQSVIALIYALKHPEHVEGIIISGTSLIGTQQEMTARRKDAEAARSRDSEWFKEVLNDWDYMIAHKTQYNAAGKDISFAPLKWWCYNESTAQQVIPIAKEISKAGRRKPVDGVYYTTSPQEMQKYIAYQEDYFKINTPVLIINGKYDTNNQPQYAEALHKQLTQSQLILIDKAGHFPWVENPEQTFSSINNWLQKYYKP